MLRTMVLAASTLALTVACSAVPDIRSLALAAASTVLQKSPPLKPDGRAGRFKVSDDDFSHNGLLAASRERLAVCVQVLDDAGIDEPAAVARVDAALRDLAAQPAWSYQGHPVVTAGFGFGPATVDAGCPSQPAVLQPGVRLDRGMLSDGRAGLIVQRASPYRVFVFVLPEPEIAAAFAGSARRTVPQEFLCKGHTCAEVTTGVYLTANEIDDHAQLAEWLHQALGMELAR